MGKLDRVILLVNHDQISGRPYQPRGINWDLGSIPIVIFDSESNSFEKLINMQKTSSTHDPLQHSSNEFLSLGILNPA
jgi:hypothetical protein